MKLSEIKGDKTFKGRYHRLDEYRLNDIVTTEATGGLTYWLHHGPLNTIGIAPTPGDVWLKLDL